MDMSILFEDKVKPERLLRDALACLLDRFYEVGVNGESFCFSPVKYTVLMNTKPM
ncbi:MAG: hypothetical protein WC015_09080 [Methanoregula sp.]